jgi:hypothetical protein
MSITPGRESRPPTAEGRTRRSGPADLVSSLAWAVHPVLLAVYPVVFLFAENIREQVTVTTVLAPLGVAVAGAIVALAVHVAILRDRLRAGLLTSLAVVLFFAYGHAWGLLVETVPDESWLQAAWVLLALAGIAVIARLSTKRARNATLGLAGIAAVLVAANTIPIAGFVARPAPDVVSETGRVGGDGETAAHRPDIYHLVFDRYAASSTLRDIYGFDNGPFLAALEERGFRIAEDSHANYLKTTMSMASTLEMDYLDVGRLEAEAAAPDDLSPVLRLLGGPMEVPVALKARGYEYVHIGTWYGPTATNSEADQVLRYGSLSEFSSVLYDSTLLPVLRGDSPAGERSEFRESYRRHAHYQFDRLARLASLDSPVPRFVLAHVSLPHPPYVFDAQGNPVTATEERSRTESRNYTEQLEYTNARILEVLDQLLDVPPGEEPVILLQADEGPYPVVFERDQAAFDWREATTEQLRQKFAVLNAFHLPGADAGELHPSISLVNTFRVVFNAYFGTDLELLPDRSYAWNADDLYDLIEVTDRLPRPGAPSTPDAGSVEGVIEPEPPPTWIAGEERTYEVSLTNVGADGWASRGPDRVVLGVQFGPGLDAPPQDWLAATRFELPDDVPPDGSVTLEITAAAPSDAGEWVLRHLLLRGGDETGARDDRAVTVDPDPAAEDPPLAASYDARPPATWGPDEEASYVVTITNEGNVTWPSSGEDRVRLSAHFGTDDDRPGVAWENEIRFELPTDVAPGESARVEVTLTAPSAVGGYVLRQRLVREGVAWFDEIHRTSVEVATPAWQSLARPAAIGVAWLVVVLAAWVTIGPWAQERDRPRMARPRASRPGDASGR